jgi:YVTN family beta-propeller protein
MPAAIKAPRAIGPGRPGPSAAPARRRRPVILIAGVLALVLVGVAVESSGGRASLVVIPGGAVGAISPSGGAIRGVVPLGTSPSGVATGGGAVWVASPSQDTVSRIDPVARAVVQTIQVGSSPTGLAVGAGGHTGRTRARTPEGELMAPYHRTAAIILALGLAAGVPAAAAAQQPAALRQPRGQHPGRMALPPPWRHHVVPDVAASLSQFRGELMADDERFPGSTRPRRTRRSWTAFPGKPPTAQDRSSANAWRTIRDIIRLGTPR